MSRIFLFILMIAMAGGNTVAVTSTDAASINREEGSLIVGVVQQDNFPLVYFDSESNPEGFEVAMVRHLAKIGGFATLEIRKFPDQSSLRIALRDHEIDLAFSKMKKNSTDAERFIYSKSYLSVEYVFLLNRKVIAKNNLQVDPLKKLAKSDLPIGTLDTPLYADQLRRTYPEMQIKLFASAQGVFNAVASGKIAGCYMDEMEVKSYLLSSPAKALHLQFLKGEANTDSVAMVFPWDKLFFREWVNIFLDKEGYTRTQLAEVIRQYSAEL